jgi:hypothetical protein
MLVVNGLNKQKFVSKHGGRIFRAGVMVFNIQHYVIQYVSDLRLVDGFLRFPPPIKRTTTI